MCQGAILWSGIETVVYGTSIRFLQSQEWRQIDIMAESERQVRAGSASMDRECCVRHSASQAVPT